MQSHKNHTNVPDDLSCVEVGYKVGKRHHCVHDEHQDALAEYFYRVFLISTLKWFVIGNDNDLANGGVSYDHDLHDQIILVDYDYGDQNSYEEEYSHIPDGATAPP